VRGDVAVSANHEYPFICGFLQPRLIGDGGAGAPAGVSRCERSLHRAHREGILAFAEHILPRASDLWVQASLDYKQRLQQLFFRNESRSTESGSIEALQPHNFSSTWRAGRVLKKV
jgi:hypothetical protein